MSDKEKNIELRSDEVQDILGKVPPWLIRRGIAGISIVVILLLVIAAWFKYPDRIVSPIQITTDNPPVYLVARTTAKISHFFAEENMSVTAGELLVVLESGADYRQVLETRDLLVNFDLNTKNPDTVSLNHILQLKGLELGNMQGEFAALQKSAQELMDFLRFDKYSIQIEGKEAEAKGQRMYYDRLYTLKLNKEKELAIAEKQLDRDKDLNKDGVKSDLELEESEGFYLAQKSQFEQARMDMAAHKVVQDQLEQSIENLKIEGVEKRLAAISKVLEGRDRFLGALTDWEQKYLLISPTEGLVSLSKFWSVNQEVKQDSRLLAIVQESSGPIIGKVVLPSMGAGKVEKGQEVIVRLDRYPYMEFGMVTGVVNSISLVPEEANYFVEVGFPNGLQTSYDQELEFTQEMTGQVEIITDVRSFLVRVFTPLKSMLKRNEMNND